MSFAHEEWFLRRFSEGDLLRALAVGALALLLGRSTSLLPRQRAPKSPWRKNPPRRSLLDSGLTARGILHDASHVAGHLFLQLEPSGGPAGTGEISATYNPLETPMLRVVHVEPVT